MFHPWGHQSDGNATRRLSTQLVARWTTEGYTAGARATIEAAAFFDGEFSKSSGSSTNVGVGYGEAGIGLYAEALYLPAGGDDWSVSAGLSVRIPAIVGLACCIH